MVFLTNVLCILKAFQTLLFRFVLFFRGSWHESCYRVPAVNQNLVFADRNISTFDWFLIGWNHTKRRSGGTMSVWHLPPRPSNQLDLSSIRQCNHFTVPEHLIRVICVMGFIILDFDLKLHVRSKHKANSLFHLITHWGNLDKHFEIKNHARDERNGMWFILPWVSWPFYDKVGSADGYYPPEEHNLPNCMCHVTGGSGKG